jgi:hypothetical protein
MEDGYRVVPARVSAAGDVFAGQQGRPASLTGPLEAARSVDAGHDKELEARIQSLVGDFVTALNGLTAQLEQDATTLHGHAKGYDAIHRQTGELLDRYRQALPG